MQNIILSFFFFFIAKILHFCNTIVKFYSILLITRFFFDSAFAAHNKNLQWPAMVLMKLTDPYLLIFRKITPKQTNDKEITDMLPYPPFIIPFLFKDVLSMMVLETILPFILIHLEDYCCSKSFIYFLKI